MTDKISELQNDYRENQKSYCVWDNYCWDLAWLIPIRSMNGDHCDGNEAEDIRYGGNSVSDSDMGIWRRKRYMSKGTAWEAVNMRRPVIGFVKGQRVRRQDAFVRSTEKKTIGWKQFFNENNQVKKRSTRKEARDWWGRRGTECDGHRRTKSFVRDGAIEGAVLRWWLKLLQSIFSRRWNQGDWSAAQNSQGKRPWMLKNVNDD